MSDKSVILVWRSDVHLADQPPQSRTDNWAETILGKVRQIGEVARRVKAQAVLDGGDFFHVKSPTRNSHALVRWASEVHRAYPCPVYSTIGNHDVKYGNTDFLNESPLGVLFETGLFRRLYDEHEVTFGKEIKVRVVGIPYHGPSYDLERFSTLRKGDEDWLVAVVHCLASLDGGTLFDKEDVISYPDLLDWAPDVWCFAHWHKNQGIRQIRTKSVVNIGSVARGSLAQDDLERTPSCAILKFSKTKVEIVEHPLDVQPAEAVFDLEGHERARERESSVETFVDNLREVLVERPEDSLLAAVRGMDVPDEIRERALFYLEQVGAR